MKKKILVCSLILFVFGLTNIFSANLDSKGKKIKLWIGNTSDWFTANNWSPPGVPTEADSVVITGQTTYSPVIEAQTGSRVICKGLNLDETTSTKSSKGGMIISGGEIVIDGTLTITTKAAMYIYPDGALTVNGTTKIANPGILEIESGGSLITNGSIGGNATVKRFIPGDQKYHFLSCPVTGNNILTGTFAPTPANFPTTPATSYDFYKFNPACVPLHWINLRNSDLTLNTADFGTPPTFETQIGYLVSYNNTFDSTKVFFGNPNTGNKTYNLVAGADGCAWNLLGNPFPSAIKWDTLPEKAINLSTGYYYVWNANKSGGAGYEAYLDLGHSSTGLNGNIPSMQGFFVKAAVSGGKILSLDNSYRIHDNVTDKWLKSEVAPTNKLTLTLANETNYDETYILFEANRSIGKDWFDAEKILTLDTSVPQIYTVIDNDQKTLFNSMPFINSPVAIPVGFVAPTTGNYSITISGFETFSSMTGLTLEDLKTNTSQNMVMNPVYTFNTSGIEDAGRFLLHFTSPIGINDQKEASPVKIFASQKTIFVTSSSDLQNATLSVYNLIGQEVLSKPLNNQPVNQVILNAPNGYYIVKVMSQGVVRTAKVNIMD